MATNPQALENAKSYHAKNQQALGLAPTYDETTSTLVRNEELGKRVGKVFQRLPHKPEDPKVATAYDALKKELVQQYQHLTNAGVKFEPWTQQGQPYANSKEMAADVGANNHLWYFPTESGFGSGDPHSATNPLTEKSPLGVPYNDLFRGVHDYFGHAIHGHEFGPQGEMRAWHEHAKLFSPAARPALTMETHGQNSWVNFGPHNPQAMKVQDRPYASQKANVLPEKLQPTKLAAVKTRNVPTHAEHTPVDMGGELHAMIKGVQENPQSLVHKRILADYLEDHRPELEKTIQYLRTDLGEHEGEPVAHLPFHDKNAPGIGAGYTFPPPGNIDHTRAVFSTPTFLGHEFTKALQSKVNGPRAEALLLKHLEETGDPRAEIIRNKMSIRDAHNVANGGVLRTPEARKLIGGHTSRRGNNIVLTAAPMLRGDPQQFRPASFMSNANTRQAAYQPVTHEFRDGTRLQVNVHADAGPYGPNHHAEEPQYDPNTRKFHVMWTGFGARNGYHTVMDPHQFYHMVDKLPEEAGKTFENNVHTQRPGDKEQKPVKLSKLPPPTVWVKCPRCEGAKVDPKEPKYQCEICSGLGKVSSTSALAKIEEKPTKLERTEGPAAALGGSMSKNADSKRQMAESILNEAGLTPSAVRTVLAHETGKGTRSSVVATILDKIDPSLSKYVAAWLGMLSQEHALTVFHSDPTGRDRLHVIHSSLPVNVIQEKLKAGGVPNFSVEEHPGGTRAYIYSHRGSLDLHIQRALGGTGATAAIFSGSGYKLGTDSGSSADSRAKYRHAIEEYESSAPANTDPGSTAPDPAA